jgi:hypothetical protein
MRGLKLAVHLGERAHASLVRPWLFLLIVEGGQGH